MEFLRMHMTKQRRFMVDMRDAFFSTLCDIAGNDESVVILSDDHGSFVLKNFANEFPDQYINVGISEQNIINLAAGMALAGYKPFVYGISAFITGRCFEQINLQLSAAHLPVTVIGVGSGFTYSVDGPTHHGLQDVILMNSIPGIIILDSSDPTSTAAFAEMSYVSSVPIYVRIEKGEFPEIYDLHYDFSIGASELIKSDKVLVITSGSLVHEIFELLDGLSGVGLLDLYRIKPVNESYLIEVMAKYETVMVVEEQFLDGGIGSIMATLMAENGVFKRFVRLGVTQHCFHYSSHRDDVRSKCGIGMKNIEKQIWKYIT